MHLLLRALIVDSNRKRSLAWAGAVVVLSLYLSVSIKSAATDAVLWVALAYFAAVFLVGILLFFEQLAWKTTIWLLALVGAIKTDVQLTGVFDELGSSLIAMRRVSAVGLTCTAMLLSILSVPVLPGLAFGLAVLCSVDAVLIAIRVTRRTFGNDPLELSEIANCLVSRKNRPPGGRRQVYGPPLAQPASAAGVSWGGRAV